MRLIIMRVRRHLATIIIVSALVCVGAAPSWLTTEVIAFWVAVAATGTALMQYRTSKVSKKFGGVILTFVGYPTPFDSLVAALQQHGISVREVRCFYMMAADVEKTIMYFKNDRHKAKLLDILDEVQDMKVVIYGPADTIQSFKHHERLFTVPAIERSTEHTNLVVLADGREFVWYEPFHDVVGNEHFFTRGAYLIAIDHAKATEVLDMYRQISVNAISPELV